MNPISNPLNKLRRNTLISAQMQTTQSLRRPQKLTQVLYCRSYKASALKINVSQNRIIFDEVFEAGDYLLVEIGKLDLFLSCGDLLICPLGSLVLKKLIVGKGKTH